MVLDSRNLGTSRRVRVRWGQLPGIRVSGLRVPGLGFIRNVCEGLGEFGFGGFCCFASDLFTEVAASELLKL